MADNTTLSTMTGGDVVRDLDRSGIKTQVVNLDISQSGEAELLGLGGSVILTFTSAGLTVASTNYASGDQMGTEVTLASVVRAARGLIVQSGVLIDKAKVCSAIDLLMFDAATTPAADNAAASWSDADMLKLLAQIHFADQYQGANNYVLQAVNLPVVLKPASGTSIFTDLIARATTGFFGAVGDVVIKLGCSVD